MRQIQLPEFYYLDNFIQLLDHVFECSREVLRPQDVNDYRAFNSLSRQAQALYTRFLMRKGWAFRPAKLSYKEIPELEACLRELTASACISWKVPLAEKLPLFTKPELCALFPGEKLSAIPRGEINAILCEQGVEIEEPVLGVEKDFFVFRLLYFGNAYQDLSDFILNDLGIQQYEAYPLGQGFIRTVTELEEFIRFYETMDGYDPEEPLAFYKSHAIIQSDNRVLRRRLHKQYFRLGRQLERMGHLEEALDVYASSKYSGERVARILARQSKFQEVERHCLELLRAARNDEEIQFARFFLAKHSKHLSQQYPKDPVFKPIAEVLYLDREDQKVERIACAYFNQFGTCFYCENLWITALFGLFFWEVIFADVPGAFSHPFQRRPHDLYEDDFGEPREELIEDVFANGFSWERAERVFDRKFGISNPFIAWSAVDKDCLQQAIVRFGQACLENLFREILKDLRNKPKGFPDLIFFPKGGGVELIEIKGPGDRLQKHQAAWLEFFDRHEIKAKVVHVQWN